VCQTHRPGKRFQIHLSPSRPQRRRPATYPGSLGPPRAVAPTEREPRHVIPHQLTPTTGANWLSRVAHTFPHAGSAAFHSGFTTSCGQRSALPFYV
jgi:hypothetical protein